MDCSRGPVKSHLFERRISFGQCGESGLLQAEYRWILTNNGGGKKARNIVGILGLETFIEFFAIRVQGPEISFIMLMVPQFSKSVSHPLFTSIITEEKKSHTLGVIAKFSHQISDVVGGSRSHLTDVAHILL